MLLIFSFVIVRICGYCARYFINEIIVDDFFLGDAPSMPVFSIPLSSL